VPGDGTANSVPCGVHGASYAVCRANRAGRAVGGSPLLAHLITKISGTATADVVDWSLVFHQPRLTLKLFVEGEDGSLLLAVHVA